MKTLHSVLPLACFLKDGRKELCWPGVEGVVTDLLMPAGSRQVSPLGLGFSRGWKQAATHSRVSLGFPGVGGTLIHIDLTDV